MAGDMTSMRKSWLIALCLGTVAMFFSHIMLSAADEAGLLPCAQIASQNDRGASPMTSSELPSAHCCGCSSDVSFLSSDLPAFHRNIQCVTFFARNDSAPEAPVYEIEYPPQLS